MYYINKMVGWVLSPLGMLFIGFGYAWLLNRIGWRKTARWCVGFVLLLMWVLSCGITTQFIGAPLERMSGASSCTIDVNALPEADAIMLLGGGMGAHEKCGAAEMLSGADRVWMAAKLWKAGKSKVIAISGNDVEKSTVPLLKDFGVDETACIYFPTARNTEEESKLMAEYGQGVKIGEKFRILLVTSAWHMPRAKMLFERRGFEVVCAPTDFEMTSASERQLTISEFIPSSEALMRNSYAIKEWIGYLGYRLLRR